MRIKSVEFAGAIGRPEQEPPGRLMQVAFSGRSNVGKSSLINRLLGRTRTQMARVSTQPGKTQEINFYHVRAGLEDGGERQFFLVDLPGYGYARVPKELRARWAPLIEGFLGRSPDLRGVVQLIDARHGPSGEDMKMVRFLSALGVPTLFALTKVDKLSRRERERQLPKIAEALGVEMDQVLPFSAKTGEGREELLGTLEALMVEGGPEA